MSEFQIRRKKKKPASKLIKQRPEDVIKCHACGEFSKMEGNRHAEFIWPHYKKHQYDNWEMSDLFEWIPIKEK